MKTIKDILDILGFMIIAPFALVFIVIALFLTSIKICICELLETIGVKLWKD